MTTEAPRSDPDNVARIARAVAAVREWAVLVDDPQVPEAGSPLANDDRVFPALPASTVTWYAITSAIDHLGLGADMLQADGVTVLRPHAFYSLTRSALLGAAQALWVLAGRDPEERAIRSLLVVEDEATAQRRYLRAYLDDDELENDVTADLIRQMREHDQRLTDRITKVRAELRARGHKNTFQSTAMIADVAAIMGSKDAWLRRAIMHQWMRGSAAAHARMWVLHISNVEEEPHPAGGVIKRMTSSIEDIAQAYGTPTLVLNEALRLWDERRQKPTPKVPPLMRVPLPHPWPPH